MNRIALIGKARAGKTTTANALKNLDYQQISFADPVKEATARMLTTFEQYILFPQGTQYVAPEQLPIVTVDNIQREKSHPAIRKLLQVVGTEIGREWFGPDTIWIDMLVEKIEKMDGPLVIDDCRFPNEAEALKQQGFFLVKLQRDEIDRIDALVGELEEKGYDGEALERQLDAILDHPSERAIDQIIPDIVVPSRDVQQLQEIVAFELFHMNEEDFSYRYTKELHYV